MRILLATDVIHAGGAETFVLRLAQALQQRGNHVEVFILYRNKIDQNLVRTFAPKVHVSSAALAFIRLAQLADGLLLKLKIDYSFVDNLLVKQLTAFLKENRFDVLHSHLFTTDKIAVAAAVKLGLPVVTTMHGDYSLLWEKNEKGLDIRMLDYERKMTSVLNKLRAVVCISEQQLHFLERFNNKVSGPIIRKIYNGYQKSSAFQTVTRASLKIPDHHFVFGMVARGIPEKGWETVLEAFNKLVATDTSLVLVGDSAYVQELKAVHADKQNIHFIGYSKNPVAYIDLFDVGLFASTYLAESLPTVIMEYLACHVPVITTNIAECSRMVATEQGNAGLIIELEEGQVSVELFKQAMQQMMQDKALFDELKSRTGAAFEQFNIDNCVDHYLAVYQSAI